MCLSVSREANLIKRNILSFEADRVVAKQAWEGKEFLASTDEGFRPVNLSNGPDGNMYVVDMHRGVIQHYAFLSPYLKKISAQKKLDTIQNFGRILKVSPKGQTAKSIPDLESFSTSQLVASLKDTNGWIRDRAQQILIHNKDVDALPKLKNILGENDSPLSQIHALYVLEGLDALDFDLLGNMVKNGRPNVASHALVLMEGFTSAQNVSKAEQVFKAAMDRNEPMVDLYLSTTLGVWAQYDQDVFFPVIYELSQKYSDKKIYQEAIVSGAQEVMPSLQSGMDKLANLQDSDLDNLLAETVSRQENDKPNYIYSTRIARADSRTNGAVLFRQICASCHSSSGEGINGLAPPLVGSEYISTHLEQLGLIILHGLKGPLLINGEVYDKNHQMPGLMYNTDITDKDISDIISYVTNAFSVKPKGLKPEKIKELRNAKPKAGIGYTEEELYQTLGK